VEKSPDAFRTISEAAEELTVPQHVLRFWETKFTQIKPMKRAGGRRYYRPADIELLKGIHTLLYSQGYTIRGVQRILKEENAAYVVGIGRGEVMPRKSDLAREGAPPPGTAKVAPRVGARAAVLDTPPKVIHRLSAGQSEALKLALKDLTDARKLLDPTSR
jgi:DNA-binding transcriptional MerR regulator